MIMKYTILYTINNIICSRCYCHYLIEKYLNVNYHPMLIYLNWVSLMVHIYLINCLGILLFMNNSCKVHEQFGSRILCDNNWFSSHEFFMNISWIMLIHELFMNRSWTGVTSIHETWFMNFGSWIFQEYVWMPAYSRIINQLFTNNSWTLVHEPNMIAIHE